MAHKASGSDGTQELTSSLRDVIRAKAQPVRGLQGQETSRGLEVTSFGLLQVSGSYGSGS